MKAFAVVGWKNSGKTTLVERLVAHFADQGLRVATIKHTHHAFLMDREGTDTDRHRRAGASQVAMVGANGWTLASTESVSLDGMLANLAPCDVAVLEGFKRSALPKIEVRADAASERLWADDSTVFAVASELDEPCPLPRFRRDDIEGLAEVALDAVSEPA